MKIKRAIQILGTFWNDKILFLRGKSRVQPALHIPRAVLVIVSGKEGASYHLNIEQQGWLEVRASLCVIK